MSLNIGLIALEGNYLADLLGYFDKEGYRLAGIEWLDTKAAGKLIDTPSPIRDGVYKLAYFDSKWTVIIDLELVLSGDTETLAALGKDLGCKVCACICAGTGGSYSFFLSSAEGKTIRNIEVFDGVVHRNEGEPLKGEPDSLEDLEETSTLALFARKASPYDYFEIDREYTVYSLAPRVDQKLALLPVPKKPWWKFW